MRNMARQLALAAASLVCLGAAEAQAQDLEWLWQAQEEHYRGGVEPGDVVTIRTVNGSIAARPTSGNELRVGATKEADDDDPAEIRIEIVEDDRGLVVCAVYPTRRGREPNRCGRGDDYRMNVRNNDVKVHFTVEVPAGIELEARTVNGSIRTEGLSHDVKARTVNGGITVESAGAVSAETTNGTIDAQLTSQPANPSSFETVNGRIRLVLPNAADANVSVRTVNGSIDTEFPLTIRGRWGPRSASGEVGDGGPEIALRTVNGSIALVRGG